ncbi:MAG: GNAT family N-acetyltransferase [Streptosporangiaceae bacterium]
MITRPQEVTTWYLEQTAPADLSPARRPQVPVEVIRAEIACPEFNRFLYTAVGGDWSWTDRLIWSYDHWQDWLSRPGTETWVAYVHGTPAGYAEFDPQPGGVVEITAFGLLPAFIGQGLGGWLLTEAASRAWDLATRWPGLPPTTRVWLHTASLDGANARTNYTKRGFRLYDTKVETEEVGEGPLGPWPGAR